MRFLACAFALLVAVDASAQSFAPAKLSFQPANEGVYEAPLPPTQSELYNQGAVHLDFNVQYMTDYEFRGIDHSDVGGPEDAPNLQFDGVVTLDLGHRLPRLFVGVFINVYDSDPVARFQEIRPHFGAELTLRPIILEVGHTTYIYPSREKAPRVKPLGLNPNGFNGDTNEVYAKITLMDQVLLRLRDQSRPLLAPYVMVAYDYDIYNGYYVEGGIKHDFIFEKTGLTLGVQAFVAYVRGYELIAGPTGRDTGFQRYQIELTARYSLNQLLNIPKRYGEWSLKGYLNYTDGLSDKLRTDTQLWGGGGIEFHY